MDCDKPRAVHGNRALRRLVSFRRLRGGRWLVSTLLAAVALRGLGLVGFVSPGRRHAEQSTELASGEPLAVVGRRGLLAASVLAGPAPARAIFGINEKPNLVEYSVGGAFNISFPPEFEVLQQAPEGLVLTGDRIQPLERMTAGAKVVSYKSLAEGWGANITEVGERLAAKRPSGIAELGEAKADFGQGLDIYQFEFQGEKLSELWLIALVQKGSENVLCNIACRTPRLLWDTKKDQFNSIMESFKPLQPVAAPAPAAAS